MVLSQLRPGLICRSAAPFKYTDHATDPVSPPFQLSLYADWVRFSPPSSHGYHLPTSSTRFSSAFLSCTGCAMPCATAHDALTTENAAATQVALFTVGFTSGPPRLWNSRATLPNAGAKSKDM